MFACVPRAVRPASSLLRAEGLTEVFVLVSVGGVPGAIETMFSLGKVERLFLHQALIPMRRVVIVGMASVVGILAVDISACGRPSEPQRASPDGRSGKFFVPDFRGRGSHNRADRHDRGRDGRACFLNWGC